LTRQLTNLLPQSRRLPRPLHRKPVRALAGGGFLLALGMACGVPSADAATPVPGLPHAAASDRAQAQPGDLALGYALYIGGVHVLDATGFLGVAEGRYRMGLTAATDGFLGRVAAWSVDVSSHGLLAPDRPLTPVAYTTAGTWRETRRQTTLRYEQGRPTVTLADPPIGGEREPVPEALQQDTLDPLSAIVRALVATRDGQGCGGVVPVFDGRQRYDLTFALRGPETLEPSDLSSFAGPALACSISFKPVAGRWREVQPARPDRDDEGRRPKRGETTAWVAAPLPGAPPVLVRLELDTSLGRSVLHLKSIERIAPDPANAGGGSGGGQP
jgi:hypothetical protein